MVNIVNMTYQEEAVSTTVSAARAKAEFAECVRKAESGEAVVITRHGKAVAALVPPERLRQIERLSAAGPEGGLAGLVGGWDGSEALAETLEASRRSRPRPSRKSGR